MSIAVAESLMDLIGGVPRMVADAVESAKPSAAEIAAFDAAFAAVLNPGAPTSAGFRIATVEDAGGRYRALVPVRRGLAPIIILAESPLRDAILEAPHPVHDRATAEQTVLFLARLRARAAIVSTHHRCTARAKSPCTGRTTACGGGRSAYRDSDPSHNDLLLYHRAHRRLTALWPNSVVVQFHGFAGRGYDTLFILSDGSGGSRRGDPGMPERVRDRIRKALDDMPAAVSCQDPADRSIRFPPLCARATVQGRALNGSPDACRRNATEPSGRFLHIEQDWSVREPMRLDWRNALGDRRLRALFDALAAELPCVAPGCPGG